MVLRIIKHPLNKFFLRAGDKNSKFKIQKNDGLTAPEFCVAAIEASFLDRSVKWYHATAGITGCVI